MSTAGAASSKWLYASDTLPSCEASDCLFMSTGLGKRGIPALHAPTHKHTQINGCPRSSGS